MLKSKSLLRYVLPCLPLGFIAAPTFAGSITVNPGQALAAAISSAQAGETVYLGAGTFNISSTIIIPTGVTVTGASVNETHINFNLPGGDNGSYGFSIARNASNVTIEQLDIHSNHGCIQMSLGDAYTESYTNVLITNNNFQYGGGVLSSGTIVFGIYGSMRNTGLQVTHNYFHDSTLEGTRNWCIWGASNSNLDYNVFYNIEDGGQIVDPGENLSFSHNYGTHIHRMGQEGGLYQGSSVTCDGNVFYDWVNPYPDSDALSIVGPSGEVNYTNNFFRASIAPGSSWGIPDSGGMHRFGISIEGTGEPANVTGNTFVGTWACCYSSTMRDANVSDNTVYGGALWGNFDGEPGPYGYGGVIASNNSVKSVNNAPNPPANTFAGPNNGSEEETASASIAKTSSVSTSSK
jgi:hypothetical protein